MEKKLYDLRGRESNIFRLYSFDKSGFIHALFYRILIFVSIIYGILLLASLFYLPLQLTIKILTIIVWILITPQLFATMKVLSMTATHGAAFGTFSKAYSQIISKEYKRSYALYKILPYFAIFIWILFFIGMLLWWPA